MLLENRNSSLPMGKTVRYRYLARTAIFASIFILLIILVQHFKSNQNPHIVSIPTASPSQLKVVLFWTEFFGVTDPRPNEIIFSKCPQSNCLATRDRNYMNVASAILFHMPDFKFWDLPSVRHPNQFYIFQMMESALNQYHYWTYPLWKSRLRNFFNLTMSFRSDSDIVESYLRGYVPHDFVEKSKSKKVVWMVSHCCTANGREDYVRELSKYISVDIFGKCGQEDPCRSNSSADCVTDLLSQYRFYLAFENSNCKDYVTEKLLTALDNDLIPIVMGGANYSTFLPVHSYIDVRDFDSPKDLATRLHEISADHPTYLRYLTWKTKNWNFPNIPHSSQLEWCQLCEMLNLPSEARPRKSYEDISEWWFKDGKCTDRFFADQILPAPLSCVLDYILTFQISLILSVIIIVTIAIVVAYRYSNFRRSSFFRSDWKFSKLLPTE